MEVFLALIMVACAFVLTTFGGGAGKEKLLEEALASPKEEVAGAPSQSIAKGACAHVRSEAKRREVQALVRAEPRLTISVIRQWLKER